MIAHLRGSVATVSLNSAVLDLQGVGYHVMCTPSTIADLRIGQEATLWTSMVVREDSMTLYGFANTEARELFGLLQTVSGVGPRLAMATLAVLEPDALRAALAEGNTTALTRVPGIGKRGAERMIVELRDKVAAFAGAGETTTAASASPIRGQIVEALVGLGFTAKQAEPATDTVLADDPGAEVSTALRAALKLLGRSR